jgi:type I restriction enzyme R subunit
VTGLLRPIGGARHPRHFTLFATDKKKRRIKIVCRYQQYEAANLIVQRVLAGKPRKGLIWHFQGSGKSLLMVFAAQKLRCSRSWQPHGHHRRRPHRPRRADQLHLPRLRRAQPREGRDARGTAALLKQDTRKIIITTIFKFGEADGVLNDRGNIVVLVDEAHRTQEGDLGIKMRAALPNAFLFGLTGTPINRRDRNTFYAFGADEDARGYMSRYGFEESIRDGATLKLHFEPRLVDCTSTRPPSTRPTRRSPASSPTSTRTTSQGRLEDGGAGEGARARPAICEDIARHYQENRRAQRLQGHGGHLRPGVLPALQGRARQASCRPRPASCHLGVGQGADERFKPYARPRRGGEAPRSLPRPNDPLQSCSSSRRSCSPASTRRSSRPCTWTSRCATTRCCRPSAAPTAPTATRRPRPHRRLPRRVRRRGQGAGVRREGLPRVVGNIEGLKDQLPEAMQKCLAFFPGVDRTQTGYEGLMAAQDCLPNNDVRDAFAAEYTRARQALGGHLARPDALPFETDYRWLSQVYVSVQADQRHGQAALARARRQDHRADPPERPRRRGARRPRDAWCSTPTCSRRSWDRPTRRSAKEFEIKLTARLRKHMGNPASAALRAAGALKERHEQGLLNSVEFLKMLLDLARDLVARRRTRRPRRMRTAARRR